MKNKVSTTFHLMEFDDYLKIIHVKIKENKDVRGYRTLLAQAAGCQLSYLSQVLAESVQLTPEHAAGLAVFWNFSMAESEYFMGLVNKARTSSPMLKELIESRLQELRKASTQIEVFCST